WLPGNELKRNVRNRLRSRSARSRVGPCCERDALHVLSRYTTTFRQMSLIDRSEWKSILASAGLSRRLIGRIINHLGPMAWRIHQPAAPTKKKTQYARRKNRRRIRESDVAESTTELGWQP